MSINNSNPADRMIDRIFNSDPGRNTRLSREGTDMFKSLLERVDSKELTLSCYPADSLEYVVKINLVNPAFDSFIRSLYDRFDSHLYEAGQEMPFSESDFKKYVRTYIVSRVRYVQRKHPALRHAVLTPIVRHDDFEILYPTEVYLILCAIGRTQNEEFNLESFPELVGETNSAKKGEATSDLDVFTADEMASFSRLIKRICKTAGMQVNGGYPKTGFTAPEFAHIEHDVNEEGEIETCNSYAPSAMMIEPSLVFITSILGTSGIKQVMPTNIGVFSHKSCMYAISKYTSYDYKQINVFRNET